MPRALARELLAEGGALAQPSEFRMTQEKRLKDGKTVDKEADIRVLLLVDVMIPRVTLRYTLG